MTRRKPGLHPGYLVEAVFFGTEAALSAGNAPIEPGGAPAHSFLSRDSSTSNSALMRTISNNGAKQVFDALWSGDGADVDAVIAAKGLKQMSDSGELERIVDDVLAANPKSVEEYRAGKDKAFNALVGQAMKASKGKANPAQVNELLKKKLG